MDGDGDQSSLLKWCGWIGPPPSRSITNFTGRFAMS